MINHLRPHRSVRLYVAALLVAQLATSLSAHNYTGLEFPTLARARVQSPNAATVDMPQPIAGTDLSIVCFKVRNTSPYDSRITAVGLDLPGTLTGFTLNSPPDGDFQLIEQVSNVPGLPDLTLDFALVTGRTFGGGRPNAGLPPSSTLTTFCVSGRVSAGNADRADPRSRVAAFSESWRRRRIRRHRRLGEPAAVAGG